MLNAYIDIMIYDIMNDGMLDNLKFKFKHKQSYIAKCKQEWCNFR